MTFQGFKSFNKKLDVEMPYGMVCIAGANGSGKSNVFDAIGFVLGELSSKSLRTENLSSLIYNGGHQGKEASRAKVEIIFDNSDNKISVDEKEVRVSREVNKQGQGTYRINGQLATRSRILSLLDEVGIDARGYAIVQQGKIAQLVDMTDKERLTIVSDISGISSYEERKQKALGELEKVEKKLGDAKLILREKENRLKDIEREKRQAERYNDLVLRAKTLKASMIDRDLKIAIEETQSIQESITRMVERKDEVFKDIEQLNQLIASMNDELHTLDAEILKMGVQDRAKIGDELDALRAKKADTRANMLSAQREVKKIEERKKDLEKNVSLNRQNLTVIERESSKLRNVLTEKEKRLDELEHSDAIKSQDHAFELQLKFNSISNDIINKRSKNARVGRLSEYREKREKLKQEKDEHEKNKNRLDHELSTKLDRESNTIAELRDIRETIEKLAKELNTLEIRKNAYQKSLDYAIRRILENKDQFGGIHGTVGSLYSVPERYALSVQVALGGARNHVVVEHENIAKECIEFLKKNKIGVATFLPLNKIRAKDVQRFVKEEGVIGYAIDLIDFDKKYWNIFSHTLFDTIIVENFETAKRVGFNRNPMVTRDGDYISRSGSVSGGYRNTIRKQQTNRNVDERAQTVKQELATLREKHYELNEQKDALTNSIIDVREQRSVLDSRISTLHADINELNDLLKGIDEQDALLKDIEKLEIEKAKIEKELKTVSKQANSAQLTELESLRDEVNTIKISLASYDAKLENVHKPERENLARVIKQNEEEKEQFKKDIKYLSKEHDELDKKIAKKQDAYNKIDDSIKNVYAKKTRMQKKIEREVQRIQEKQDKTREYDQKILAKNMKLAEKNERKRGLQEQLQDFENTEIIRIVNLEDRKNELKELEKEISNAGPINQKALEMYDAIKTEYDSVFERFSVLDGERGDVLIMIDEIEKRKARTFLKTFTGIAKNFARVFEDLTGGEGYLDLTNTENPLEGGVDIRVRTSAEKKLTHLRSLSGGEKSITALALLFAIQEHTPTPFYVLDEIDAALDKENSEKLARLLKKYSDQAQMIVISHNDAVISVSDYLYGVSMNKLGESSVVGVKLP